MIVATTLKNVSVKKWHYTCMKYCQHNNTELYFKKVNYSFLNIPEAGIHKQAKFYLKLILKVS